MSVESHRPGSGIDPAPAGGRVVEPLGEADAQVRADLEEDRRRQRELDDSELGGEG